MRQRGSMGEQIGRNMAWQHDAGAILNENVNLRDFNESNLIITPGGKVDLMRAVVRRRPLVIYSEKTHGAWARGICVRIYGYT